MAPFVVHLLSPLSGFLSGTGQFVLEPSPSAPRSRPEPCRALSGDRAYPGHWHGAIWRPLSCSLAHTPLRFLVCHRAILGHSSENRSASRAAAEHTSIAERRGGLP